VDLPTVRLGANQICVENHQPLEINRQGLQEGREWILGDAPMAYARGALGQDSLIGRPQMGIPPVPIAVLAFRLFRWIAAR